MLLGRGRGELRREVRGADERRLLLLLLLLLRLMLVLQVLLVQLLLRVKQVEVGLWSAER